MRLLIACLTLLMSVELAGAQEIVAQGPPLTLELVDAYRDYAIARQQLIRYRQVILPMKRQLAVDALEQTHLELAVLDRRLRDYVPALQIGEHSPVRTAAENDLLSRNAARQRLRRLQDEDIALMRFSGETDELYQYDLLRAALRVRMAQAALMQ
jgi:hypothetical protein